VKEEGELLREEGDVELYECIIEAFKLMIVP
jgi:hypothetical protein